jgi:hypothetical protein
MERERKERTFGRFQINPSPNHFFPVNLPNPQNQYSGGVAGDGVPSCLFFAVSGKPNFDLSLDLLS